MEDPRPPERHELMVPYEHPYRHALGAVWREQLQLRSATGLAAALGIVGAVGVAMGMTLLGLILGLGAMLGAFVAVLWIVAVGRRGWTLTRAWDRPTDLGAVRAHRPQAGTEDPAVAHDEFAVAVREDGTLVTWRFRPLRVSGQATDLELEVPGRPRYAASRVTEATFDVQDTARASEQLVEAQARAAVLEEEAAAAAGATFDGTGDRAEHAIEARTTAAALQRTTGQRPRRD